MKEKKKQQQFHYCFMQTNDYSVNQLFLFVTLLRFILKREQT